MQGYILAALLAGAAAHACIAVPMAGGAGSDPRDPMATIGAVVLGDDVLREQNAPLLDVMERNIPTLMVRAGSGHCPALSLRGPNTAPGLTDPRVYVDGTRTLDTCILTSLRAGDVRRVEIYPMGVTRRPGYSPHTHGLILVFLRDA